MEITANYLLFMLGLLIVVFNIFTTREAVLFPLFSIAKKALIIAIIWLVPVIGLVIAYKLLHLNPAVSSSGSGDGVHFYPGGSINKDNYND